MKVRNSLVGILLFMLTLSGCSLLPDKVDETKGWSAQKFYSEAKFAMSDGDYEKAITYLEGLEARYPFGRYSKQAQLDVAYAYYKDGQHDAAIAAANRFIKLNPRNTFVDYAYYLRGVVNFNRNLTFITRFVPSDTSQRDPGSTLAAFNDFSELVQRFPNSNYAEDARNRMIYLRNNLAMHEVHVAHYYVKRGAYLAAANRSKVVIEKYQRTPAVQEALAILVASYEKLGLEELSLDAARVYAINEASGNFIIPDPDAGDEISVVKKVWNYLEFDD
ncbi:MAG: outer membrane protein assembly factor BamD [Gammaproteobacteria bacterium]|nr:outer membrane protein assembly factor BamD [Gammaproteobacteria bacterium]